jgi:hypothetical protein
MSDDNFAINPKRENFRQQIQGAADRVYNLGVLVRTVNLPEYEADLMRKKILRAYDLLDHLGEDYREILENLDEQ